MSWAGLVWGTDVGRRTRGILYHELATLLYIMRAPELGCVGCCNRESAGARHIP